MSTYPSVLEAHAFSVKRPAIIEHRGIVDNADHEQRRGSDYQRWKERPIVTDLLGGSSGSHSG